MKIILQTILLSFLLFCGNTVLGQTHVSFYKINKDIVIMMKPEGGFFTENYIIKIYAPTPDEVDEWNDIYKVKFSKNTLTLIGDKRELCFSSDEKYGEYCTQSFKATSINKNKGIYRLNFNNPRDVEDFVVDVEAERNTNKRRKK